MCKRNPGDPRFSNLSLANFYILIMKNIRSCSMAVFSLDGLAGGTAAKGRRGQWLHQVGVWGAWSQLTSLRRLPAVGRTDPPTLPCPHSAVRWPEITLFANLKEACRGLTAGALEGAQGQHCWEQWEVSFLVKTGDTEQTFANKVYLLEELEAREKYRYSGVHVWIPTKILFRCFLLLCFFFNFAWH